MTSVFNQAIVVKIRTCFFLILFLFPWVIAYGQENSFLNFTVADGLPSTEVYQVIQDKKGFIWFATDNGVVRFDGGFFEVIDSSLGLSDPVVFGLHEDPSGRIWFRTFTGKLSYYLNGKVERYKFNDSITQYSGNAIVSDLYYDSLEQLWISAGDLFIKIDKTGKSTTEKVSRHTISLRQLNPEKQMIAFSGPTQRINAAEVNNQYFPIHQSDTAQSVNLICTIRWGNHTYVSINSDLFEYDGSFEKVFTAPSPIISLSIDREKKLWIGNLNNGVQRIEDTTFKQAFSVMAVKDKSVTKVLQDQEKGYWITTLEKGVYYFPDFSIHRYSLNTQAKISSVITTANTLITTGYSGKIIALDKQSSEVLWLKESQDLIITAYADKKNQIWVSTTRETFILNEKGEIIREGLPPSLIDFTASSLYIYGINSIGIYKFDLSGRVVSEKVLNTQFRNIYSIKNELYIGGKNGLFLFDSLFNYVREFKSFSDIKISNVTALNDSVLLISTIGNGFMILNKNIEHITRYSSHQGFTADNIYTVLNLDSVIWFGTEKGIAVSDKISLLNGNPEFHFLTKRSGLIHDKVNFLAMAGGKIWAFCDDGYTKFPVSKLNYISTHPIGYIKEVTVNNEIIDFQNTLNLGYQDNNIQINTGFLSYNNQNIFTRFRLNSSEPWSRSNDWIYSFNSLTPGNYDFQIEYSTDNLNWYLSAVNLKFEIHPPWWKIWWVRLSAGFTILLTGIFIYRRSVNQYKQKNAFLQLINEQQKKLLNAEIETTERERSRIAKDLHDSIGMDLVSIKLMANQIAKNPMEKDVLEIQEQLQKTISEIQNIIYGLTPSGLKLFGLSHGLENYISMVIKNHPVSINLDYKGNEIKDQQSGAMVFRIIQELVTNSVKHSQCKTISIDINVYSSYIQIKYRDDGIGFDPDKVIPGLGLSNIQSRVDSLEGDIKLNSDSTGTCYSINLPLHGEEK